jgi:DNA ligase-associated metallophosphoesterase
MHPVEIASEGFELFPQKALYWKRREILLIADLHLGKVNHFRRAGIPVPSRANDRNLEVLVELIQHVNPKRLICLGDLFHSHYNQEWEVFGEVVKHFPGISFELVLGNHDIMSDQQYKRKGIGVVDELVLDKFVFSHHPKDKVPADHYNLSGHLHPGVRLLGKGRQSLTFPCFYFGKQQGLLPAFGMFTGFVPIHPRQDDQIFAIVEDKIMDLKSNLNSN